MNIVTTDRPDERRWSFGAWLTLSISVAWVLVALVTAFAGYRYPSDGWTYNSNATGTGMYLLQYKVSDRASPLQRGDQILAINGRPLRAHVTPPLPSTLQVGQIVHYTIQRAGQTLDVSVPLVLRPPSALIRSLGQALRYDLFNLLNSLCTLLVAGFVFAKRPSSRAARSFALIFSYYFAGTWFGSSEVHIYMWAYPTWLLFLNLLWGTAWFWFFFPTWIMFVLAFPIVKWPLQRFPRLFPMLLYGPLTLAFVLATVVGAIRRESDPPEFTFTAVLAFGIIVSFALTVLTTLAHNFLTVRDTVQRAQLRWIALGLGMWTIGLMIGLFGSNLVRENLVRFDAVSALGFGLGLTLPLALAIAITRYRLFDIEIIIRRTLVYSLLTLTLGLVYVGCIILSRTLVAPLTRGSELAIVASTLAIAALFNPLRKRIQNFIDKRFYRRKYDAAKVLAAFGATARDETDLDALTAEMLRVVDETMQPEFVGLWLREPERNKEARAAAHLPGRMVSTDRGHTRMIITTRLASRSQAASPRRQPRSRRRSPPPA